jgi:hypothetical protein
MKDRNIIQIGGILFFIGIILITISWNYSFPVSISSINEVSLSQFYPSLWPGLISCMIGIFLIGFFNNNKNIKAVCCSIFPLLLYIPCYFYSYISSSDCGSARGDFEIFHIIGINSKIIPYFEFPTSFSLNEIIHQTTALDEKGIAFISFTLYGILLGLFLYLFFLNLKKQRHNELIPFLLVIIFFIGIFPFLNYQWVPQTLALVFFFLLIFISTYMIPELTGTKWKVILILVFISLAFTHPFISVFFILFFGFLTLRRRYLVQILLAIVSIYLLITIYYTTINFLTYIEAFENFKQIGREYSIQILKSIGEPESIASQFISLFNRINVPMIWILSVIGTVILFLKRKIDFVLIALGLAGGIYLAVGMFYSILGVRAAQILLIPITIGFMFFISKWRKPTIAIIIVILILAVFGPMRVAYNNTQFQIDEDANACNFLSIHIKNETNPSIAINQVNYGYLAIKHRYLENTYISIIRPGSSGFLDIFNGSLNQNDYVFYNSNLGKEILISLLTKEQLNNTLREVMDNNKIYDCGKTFIINGIISKTKQW